MNKRREFLKQAYLSAVIGATALGGSVILPRPKQVFGYANWLEMDSFPAGLAERCRGGKVFVDGVEIKLAWYVNTETGIVKTYNVFHDGKPYSTARGDGWLNPFIDYYREEGFYPRKVECPKDGALSETLRGKVELFTA